MMATQTRKPTSTIIAEQNADVEAAAALVLEREENRLARLEKRRQRQARQRDKAQLAAVHRMQQSIEVMKWCIVGITTIMFLGIVIAIWTLSALHTELEKVQADVEKVRPQVERIIEEVAVVAVEVERVREALRNPMQSIGSAFGAELDAKLQNYMGSKLGGGSE
jgi:regulator of replication initiation timing